MNYIGGTLLLWLVLWVFSVMMSSVPRPKGQTEREFLRECKRKESNAAIPTLIAAIILMAIASCAV